MSGRNPPLYCTLTLIAMQGHQQKGRQTNTSSNNKDKSNTIIETSTAEDHDDENLHNPSTRPRYSPESRRRAVSDLFCSTVLSMKPRPFVKSFFDMQGAPIATSHTCFFLISICLFGAVIFSAYFFLPFPFSLCMEFFVPCGQVFDISFCENSIPPPKKSTW